MRLSATRLRGIGVGAGLPSPALSLDLTTEAAIDALTFSRTTGATRIGADGTFQWARENLCRYTDGTRWEQSVWVRQNTTITNSAYTIASGEFAGQKMGLLSRVDAVSNSYAGTSALSGLTARRGPFHAAIVVKAASAAATFFAMRVQGSYPARIDAKFNVFTGEVVGVVSSSGFTDGAATVINRGDGCYELHLTGKIVGSNLASFYFGPATSGGTVGSWEAAGATNPCYITRPQLNSGTSTDYYEAQANFRFMPRMRRSADGAVEGLWIETAATNLNLSELVVVGTVFNAALGVTDQWGDFARIEMACTASTGNHYGRFNTGMATTSGQAFTISCVLFPDAHQFAQLVFPTATHDGNSWANFVLSGEGSVGTVGSSARNAVIKRLGNGGYLCCLTATANQTSIASGSTSPIIGFASSSTDTRLPSLTTVGTEKIRVACCQTVQAEEWSSYVPTFSATATRAVDVPYVYGGIGPELVVNGGFADGSGWADASTAPATSAIAGGVATLTADGTNRARLRQNVAVEIGKTYRIRVRAIDAIEVWVGSGSGFTDLLQITLASGIREGVFTATTTMASITLTTTGQSTYRLDDVSLKEAAPCDGFVQGQGALVVVADRNVVPAVSPTNRCFCAIYGTSSSNRVVIFTGAAVGGQHRAEVIDAGASQAVLTMHSAALTLTRYAIGISFSANNFIAGQSPAGTTVTDNTGVVPLLSSLHLGHQNQGGLLNGAIKKVMVFNRPLTAAQLERILTREVA